MAEKAQAEPTMEEILASIRKIIADDGEGTRSAGRASAKAAPSVAVNVSEDDDFDDLSLEDVIEQSEAESVAEAGHEDFEPISEDDTGELLSDVDEEMFEELAARSDEPEEDVTAEAIEELEDFDLEAVSLDDEEPVIEDSSIEDSFDASGDEWEKQPVSFDRVHPEPEPEPEPAPPPRDHSMLRGKTESAPQPAASAGLTDERIAGAAASALGKLMVKQSAEAGNPNTLEGLMMEMLRPMIKEWLDANLPGIVERKVEEEVQRIARMAR